MVKGHKHPILQISITTVCGKQLVSLTNKNRFLLKIAQIAEVFVVLSIFFKVSRKWALRTFQYCSKVRSEMRNQNNRRFFRTPK